MHRIPIALLLSIVSILSIGALDSFDTSGRSPALRALGTEPSDRFQVPKFVRWDHSPPAAPLAKATTVPATPDADWLAGIERGIAAREYQASVNHRGLQAPNRAQNLRTYFEPEGIRVMDRTAPGEPELVRIRLSAFGRENALAEAGDARVSHAQARVELAREGLVEWYENSPAGLEQGFTVAVRPAGDGPLVLELRVDGAGVSLHGGEATLASTSEGGRRLEYAKLAAFDANGVPLAARLEARDDGLRIVTDDRDAAYPVTIDPLVSNTFDTQINSVAANAQFGQRVASAGDVNGDGYGDFLVGAEDYDNGQTNEGGAFLYLGSPSGIAIGATPNAIFQSNQDQARFGRGLGAGDFNGDGYSDVVVGAYLYGLGQSGEGAAFVFNGGPSGIMNGTPASASATLQSDQDFSRFGIAVACAGDINGDGYDDVVVGASDWDGLNVGAAFIFTGSASGIANASAASAATRLISTQGSSNFGWNVAGVGDINADGYSDVAVGCYQYDSGSTNEGAIFIYLGSASGIQHGTQNTASGSVQSDIMGIQFGFSLTGAGDVNGDGYSDIAAGTQFYGSNQGAAWVFHGGSAGIGHLTVGNAATTIVCNQASAFMAATGMLAGAGDVNGDGYGDLIVGADRFEVGETDEGAAFVFLGGAAGITATSNAQAYAHLQPNQISARMGGVAGVGDVNGDGYDDVMAGAVLWGASDEGAAFLALGGAKGMSNGDFLSARALIESNQALPAGTQYPQLGKSVASAGDVNGDGIGDIIVGSPGYDLGEVDEGAAFVFLGGAFANGNPANAHATLQSNTTSGRFGESSAGAGDVNDDGYADVIVGAPGIPGGGEVYVFMGSAAGVANGDRGTAATAITSEHSGTELGVSVAGAGDVNGDGFADVVVGAEQHAGGMGGVFVFLGSATGVPSGNVLTAATQLVSSIPSTRFGHSVAGAGDVNGDGFADIVVGAPYYSGGGAGDGLVFVFHGSASGIVGTDPLNDADAVLDGIQNNAHMGISVAGAGDINGDGYGDVIAGADGYGTSAQGAAFVWLGSANGVPNASSGTAHVRFLGALANGYFGASVACAGDLNGDGCSDLIVGQPDPVNFLGQGNIANVYMGTRTLPPVGFVTPARATLSGLQGGQFGASVAGVGDVDGDGFADVIVGAPTFDWSESNEGIACLFNGGSVQLGRSQRVVQLTGTGVGRPIQPWGRTYSSDRFQVAAPMVDAEGRKRVKLEIENCPNGVAFGSGSCTKTTSATWLDAGANPNGLSVTELLTSVPGGLRRWRARTLVAPFNVTKPGITAPPNPRHGPWRRVQGQVVEADVRVMLATVGVEIRTDPSSFSIERLVNPTRGRIEFTAVLSGNEPAKAELFDVAGRRWLSRDLPSGVPTRTEFQWEEGRHLPSGTYLLRLTQGARAATARIVMLR